MTQRVLVAGLGNEYRCDDGAGPAVAAYVGERTPSNVDSKVIREPLDLVGAWDNVDLAVIADATRSGATPGTVQLVDLGGGENADSYAGPMSTHGMDLARVLRLARAMGLAPRRVVVVGIEGENFEDGIGLSPAIEVAVPEAGELVLQVIDEAISCA
ncbi:MAG: hydrogenase maturation protease [Acidimicrobiales bacterium]